MERVEADRRELLDGLRRGDAAAFDRVYARYRDRIYRFLRRLTGGDRPLADDLFQETFLKLARHAFRLRDDTDLAAWLYTVARNEYRALRTELRPRFEEPRQKARARIRALLTPEQQQKFDGMIAQQDAQRDEQKSRH